MKQYIFLLIFIGTFFGMKNFALAQKDDYKKTLCVGTWVLDNHDTHNGIFTYKQHQKDDQLAGRMMYIFNKDGDFSWNSNPTCGTTLESTSGGGKWKLYENNTCLKLTFSNKTNYLGAEEKGGVFEYKVISINKNELKISPFRTKP